MAMGPIAEWKNLYRYYEDVKKYTSQLRALEKAAAANPGSAAEHFLLGYHFSMMGVRQNAEAEFAVVAKLSPGDTLAAHYLKQLGSNAPLTPPRLAAAPQGQCSKPSRQSSPYFCILACRVGRGIPNRRAACV